MEAKHTPNAWTQTSKSLPGEYEEVYAKHKDGSVRIARLSKAEGGCWQLATFLVGTKRPGYAWPVDQVVAWRAIQPETLLSRVAPDLLQALRVAYSDIQRCPGHTIDMLGRIEAAISKATGEGA